MIAERTGPPRSIAGTWLALTILVLALQLAGAHEHLCFDGLEAHQSLHWALSDVADELRHAAASHSRDDLCVRLDAPLQVHDAGATLPASAPLRWLRIAFVRSAPVKARRVIFTPPAVDAGGLRRLFPPAQAPPR